MSAQDGAAGMLGGMTDAPMTREQAEQSEIGQLELGTDYGVDYIAPLVGVQPLNPPQGGVYVPEHIGGPRRPITPEHARQVVNALNAHPAMQLLGRVAHVREDVGDGHVQHDERGNVRWPGRYIVMTEADTFDED